MTRMARIGLISLVLVASCGDDSTTTSTTAPATTTSTIEDPVVIVVDGTSGSLQLSEDGESRDVGDRIDVDLGDTIRIVITLAEENEVHVHSYDVSVVAPAGEQVQLEFVADIAGIFEVELHEGEVLLFELEVA